MRRMPLLAVAVCTAALAGTSASTALAGEVTGPPGTPNVAGSGSGTFTQARTHANSICAYSGLNDLLAGQGPIDFIVQSPGQDVRNGGPAGIPGLACGPGSNPNRLP